jgi:hypothetical protein
MKDKAGINIIARLSRINTLTARLALTGKGNGKIKRRASGK